MITFKQTTDRNAKPYTQVWERGLIVATIHRKTWGKWVLHFRECSGRYEFASRDEAIAFLYSV